MGHLGVRGRVEENDRSIVGFVMIGHGLVHTYELSIPILMTIWLLEFSTTPAVLGVAVAVGYALFGIGSLPGGLLVDRFGSRTLVIVCLAGMGLSFIVLSLAPGVLGVALALVLWGTAASVYHPAGLTLISNGVEQRGRGFAYHGIAGNIGIAAGPLLTALLLLAFDWRVVVIALAVPALVGAVVGIVIEFDPTAAIDVTEDGRRGNGPESLVEFVTETRRLFTVGFLMVFVIVAFNGLYYRGVLTFLPDLLGDFLTAAIGDTRPGIIDPDSPIAEEFDLAQYLFAGLLMVGVGGQYLGGRLTDAIEPDRGLIGMTAALTIVALLFVPAAGTGLWGVIVVSCLLGFTLFALQPLTQATIAKYSVPESRGLSFGYTYLAIFGIGALGAAIAGTVLTYASVSVMFLVLAAFSTASCLIALSLVISQ